MKSTRRTTVIICLLITALLIFASCDLLPGGSECTDHTFGTDGKCTSCGYACAHSFGTDGKCTVCNYPCTHNYNSNGICSECAYVCTHSYTETVIPPTCTDEGYTEKKCTVCKLTEKTDVTAPTNVHSGNPCTVCGFEELPPIVTETENHEYYYNLIVNNLDFAGTLLVNSFTLPYGTGSINLSFAELSLRFGDEDSIIAEGRVNYSTSNDDSSENITGTAEACIRDGIVYIASETDNDGLVYITCPINELDLSGSIEGMESIEKLIEYIAKLANDITPLLKLIDLDETELGSLVERIITLTCDVDKNDLGYCITFSIDKIMDLNDDIYGMDLRAFINFIADNENAYGLLMEKVRGMLDTKIGDFIDLAEENGLSTEDIMAVFSEMFASGGSSFTEDQLNSLLESYKSKTLVEVLNSLLQQQGDTRTVYEIINEYRDTKVYELFASAINELLASVVPDQNLSFTARQMKEIVDVLISALDGKVEFTADTDNDANITYAKLKLDVGGSIAIDTNPLVSGDELTILMPSIDIELRTDYTSIFDYNALADNIKVSKDKLGFTSEQLTAALNASNSSTVYTLNSDGTITATKTTHVTSELFEDESFLSELQALTGGATLTKENAKFEYSVINSTFDWSKSMISMSFDPDDDSIMTVKITVSEIQTTYSGTGDLEIAKDQTVTVTSGLDSAKESSKLPVISTVTVIYNTVSGEVVSA